MAMTAATMQVILSQAGISAGAAYYYFDNKADLFTAAVGYYVGQLLKPAMQAAPIHDRDSFWRSFPAGTIRKGTGFWGRFRSKSTPAGGVNSFSPDGMKESLAKLGVSNVCIHYDSPRWMILSGQKE